MGADDAWVTVERFVEPVAAQVARSRLEAEGIACYLADEGVGGLFAYGLVRGVRLQVRAEDERRALEVLREPPVDDGALDSGDPGESAP